MWPRHERLAALDKSCDSIKFIVPPNRNTLALFLELPDVKRHTVARVIAVNTAATSYCGCCAPAQIPPLLGAAVLSAMRVPDATLPQLPLTKEEPPQL